MTKIIDCIQKIDDMKIARAKKYLESNKVISAKLMNEDFDDPDEFEAFIGERGTVFMPVIEVDKTFNVLNTHCQCNDESDMCVHKAALLLAAQLMIEVNCPDYHMAVKLQIANFLSNILS